VEWCYLTCPFHVAKAHLDKGIPITYIHISQLFATDKRLPPEELDPSCFRCHLGEGDSAGTNLIQCERCLRWIHTYCLPQPITPAQAILKEGWTCHECKPPSISKPCPHQLCTIQFTPTPHKPSDIRKLQGDKLTLTKFLKVPIAPTSPTIHHTALSNTYPMNTPQTQARTRGITTPPPSTIAFPKDEVF
jgi:hypothetical protein